MLSCEELKEMYEDDAMTMKEISAQTGLAVGTIFNYMKKYGISSRPAITERTKARISHSKLGKPSPMRGYKMSDEVRQKIADAKTGVYRKPSEYGGHKRMRTDGYVKVYVPDHPYATKDGYVMEHILVMEKAIGRYITRDEVVHHKNKVKSDNRLENLSLMTFKEHASMHSKERWLKRKGENKHE